ncbi:Intraflagellar transport protein 20, partial [Entophlyctis sp. JEL0112]
LINYAVPGSVDESKLYANPKHVVQRAENLQIMLQGAVAAGVRVMCQAVDSQDLLTRLAAALAALKDRDAEIAVLRAQLSAVTAAAGTTTPNGQSKEVGAALHATSAASNSVAMNTEAQVAACCDASERMQQLQRENAKLVELSSQLAASLQSLEAAVIVSDPDLARRRSLVNFIEKKTFIYPEKMPDDLNVTFDEFSKIRILPSDQFEASESLKDECKDFTQKIDEFNSVVQGFLEILQAKAEQIEIEKLKAIGLRNRVESEMESRKAKRLQ